MTRFEKWSVWTTSAATVLTGIGYGWTRYLVSTPDPWAVVNHPLGPWFLKIHIVVAPLLVFALGMIALRHIWKHITTGVRKGRRTGLVLVASVVPMVATGYLIQIVTHAGLLKALAISHIGFGLLFALAIGAHQVVVRARRAAGVRDAARDAGARHEPPVAGASHAEPRAENAGPVNGRGGSSREPRSKTATRAEPYGRHSPASTAEAPKHEVLR